MRSLTVVVPTYQRRAALRALLDSIAAQLGDPGAAAGVDVLVVVDGSTDGSAEMVETMSFPAPLRALRQPNAGLAAARNAGLAEARGELVWFLDDDMVLGDGVVARHRAAHEAGEPALLMGPCIAPPEVRVVHMVREWAELQYGDLARAGRVERAMYFSAANTSGAVALWREVGGFDESFVGWGSEDYDIAVRLLEAGVAIRYDHEAVAWHHQQRDLAEFMRTKFDEGRNTVRTARIHPAALDEQLPVGEPGRVLRGLRRMSGGRPAGYRLLARALVAAARLEQRLTGERSRRLFYHAVDASFLAGLAALDSDGRYVERLFGRSGAAAIEAAGLDQPGEHADR
jgi:GT2 family glycosyltransferase